MYDGEGDVVWPEHLHDFLSFLENEEDFDEVHVSMLLAYTLCGFPELWCCKLPPVGLRGL